MIYNNSFIIVFLLNHKLIIVPTKEIIPVTQPKTIIKIEYFLIFGFDLIELDYNFK